MYRQLQKYTILLILIALLTFAISAVHTLLRDFSATSNMASLLPSTNGMSAAWQTHRADIMQTYLPNTLRVTLYGLSLSILLGLTIATLMHRSQWIRWLLYPLIVTSQTIPTFAIAVMLILLFGFGDGPKIIVVMLFCFFPVAANTLDGFRSISSNHIDLLRALNASDVQIWWHARIPAALPQIFSGIRIAATYSVVGAVIGEYVGSGDGLGKFLQRSYRAFEVNQVFLAILVISITSLALVGFITLIEFMMLRWRYVDTATQPKQQPQKEFTLMQQLTRLLLILSLALVVIMPTQAQDDLTPVKLMLDYTPNTNHIGFYVAQAEGFYEDAGLSVEIFEPTDLLVESAIDAGVVEFGVGFQEFTTFAMASETDVVSIAAIIQDNTSGFATLSEKYTLETPADLAELTYGGFSFPDLENAILSAFLACDGAEWPTDNYLDIGYSNAIELMTRDRIDSAWIFYGWQGIQAELDGLELSTLMLNDYADCMPNYYTPILLTSSAVIDAQPEIVSAFVQATAQGYNLAVEQPEAAAEHLIAAVPELDSDLVAESTLWLSDYFISDAPYWGYQDADVWTGFSQFLIDNALIPDEFDATVVFTNEFAAPPEEE